MNENIFVDIEFQIEYFLYNRDNTKSPLPIIYLREYIQTMACVELYTLQVTLEIKWSELREMSNSLVVQLWM